MPRFRANDRMRAAAATRARRQHGVISTAELRACGLSSDRIADWVRCGRLQPVHRGAYAVGHLPVSDEGWWMAAVLALGDGAALSHRSAAALWGIAPRFAPEWSKPPVDVIVPGRGGRAPRRGIRVHRSITLVDAEVTRRRGIAVTTPARTLADLRRVASRAAWDAALREAEFLRLRLDGLFEGDRTRSGEERRLLRLCRRQGLPRPEANVRIGAYTVDFLWRDARLVVEVDTYGTHGGRSMFHADRTRDAWLKRNGYEVLRVTDRWMREAPDEVAATIRTLLRRVPSG
jgi:very-short-patch-repair endonuclease